MRPAMGANRLDGVLPLMVEEREETTTRLPDLDDELELARRLREALWPGGEHPESPPEGLAIARKRVLRDSDDDGA